ncbi:MAG TPA: anthranilate phosphoribosyltransferase [Nitrospiraceae bacterium]|nr:anthranilate phosphoribosyltransferase [Nitrospiraceae bacterium]
MIKDAISKLADRIALSEKEAEEVMGEIMDGSATSAQIAGYLMGLRMKGETVEEIAGSVRAMRARAVKIRVAHRRVVDTCGTGGDRAHTFNISTTAAFVVAGAGVAVAKHGNRSVSSQCGSADVLAELGVKLDLPADRVADCVDEVGIGFLFAPLYHSAMKHCAAPRQELGIRTLLNILGPLTNPAGAGFQVIGVFDGALTELLAKVLLHLGSQHCYIVHGLDGLDEVTLTDRTRISEGKAGVVSSYFIEPKDFGLGRVAPKDLRGGTPEQNAVITRDILHGRKGPKRDVVCLNAAPALVSAGAAKTLQDGFVQAQRAIDCGAAMDKLDKLIAFTNRA